MTYFKDLQQQGLNRSISDHIPIFLCNESIDWGPRPFKFINAWFKKKDCMCLIEKEWSGLRCFNRKMAVKLRKLKGILKKWNVEDGNKLEKRIIESESRIKEMDEISEKRELTVKELEELKHLNTELWDAVRFKESIWRQKSRMTWLKEGDAYSAFFHRAVKIKAKRRMVFSLRIGDRCLKEPKEMKEGLYNYFKSYFNFFSVSLLMDFGGESSSGGRRYGSRWKAFRISLSYVTTCV
ncbi:hypothetical protein PVK06_006490 [Gossypium arboreum]|uniref:Reverse transcriptase n=1 Tax=Gossypium arboreum TaxID=29729 RepID=A0ABR0QEW1_GOSAR|nr:hypothetical protein PVK06_006490 [Gossypium arboreum]